jgi:pyruvate, water dikinase
MPVDHYLYWLDQIQPAHRPWVGDKAFYLGLLAQQHPAQHYAQPPYEVVPGFVLSAALLQDFLPQLNWVDPWFADFPHSSLHIDVDNARQLQTIAQKIRQTIQTAAVPEAWLDLIETSTAPWAEDSDPIALMFRPSLALPGRFATISARTVGLLEAQVCWRRRDAIAQALKQVWAELFRAKSLIYWQRLGIPLQQVNLAVLVQPLMAAQVAGEVRQVDHTLEIRSVWGLGQAIAQGVAVPHLHQVNLSTHRQSSHAGRQELVYEKAIAGESPIQQVPLAQGSPPQTPLTSEQINTLVQLTQAIAQQLGMPVGLEWLRLKDSKDRDRLDPRILKESGDLWRRPDSEDRDRLYLTQIIPQLTVQSLTGLNAAPGIVTAPAWVVDLQQHPALQSPAVAPSGAILVTQNLTPDWLLHLKHMAGVVTEQGGMTSHAAILAREMGIPAVLGVAGATWLIKSGEEIRIDGDRGQIHWANDLPTASHPIENPAEIPAEFPTASPAPSPTESPAPSPNAHPAIQRLAHFATPDAFQSPQPHATQLLVTLSQPESLQQIAQLPPHITLDGVGLLRSELMLLEALEHQHPRRWLEQGRQAELIDRIAQKVTPFAQTFSPRSVFYRSLDWRAHEFPTLDWPIAAHATMLGLRGTLSYQLAPAQFEVELLALRQLQLAGFENINLLLPFVRTVEEFSWCRQQAERVGLTQNPQFQIWIMAEVPSVLLLLPDYVAAGVQGIAIGSNDLTQLLLGVDREMPELAIAFEQQHPVVLRAIRQLIQGAKQLGIPCTLCGQAPGQHPSIINELVNWGITAISVSPAEIEQTYGAIARAEQRLLLEAARQILQG